MEFFRDTKIDFMKYRKVFLVVSAILAAVGLLEVFIKDNLNIGVDFAGGTEIKVAFQQEPEVDAIRSTLEQAGLGDSPVIQRFGEPGENQIIIRTASIEGSEEGSRDLVVGALDSMLGQVDSGLDLNKIGSEALAEKLVEADPDGKAVEGVLVAEEHYSTIADAILELRRDDGLVHQVSEVSGVDGVSPAVADYLTANASTGAYSVVGVENVGPQIGKELRRKGVLAVVLSLLGMLLYIWLRFELRFGIGALVATVHDVLITLGLFTLFGYEFNLTTIAAFLTLVGYSVNDTVVIFDRVRENMRRHRRMRTVDVMNLSLNQTLSRTILTSGSTLLAVLCLYFLGGDVTRGFAFVLMIGVVIGTYSSIFIAGPFALLWEKIAGKRAAAKAA